MASALYPYGKEAILNKQIDMDSDTIKVAGVSTSDYTYDAGHQYKNIVPSYNLSIGAALSNKSISLGVFDADDLTPYATNLAIDGTKTIDAWVLYYDTGDTSTSPLIAYIDISANPITPNSSDVNITWDDGINKIFRI